MPFMVKESMKGEVKAGIAGRLLLQPPLFSAIAVLLPGDSMAYASAMNDMMMIVQKCHNLSSNGMVEREKMYVEARLYASVL